MLYYHTTVTPVVVYPRQVQVIDLPLEYIMPRDGHAKQDCEQAVDKRWITQHLENWHIFLLNNGSEPG
jgi:hypothetical protein